MSRPRVPLPTRVQDLATLPAAAERLLDEGVADLRIELPAGARAALVAHLRLLLAWTVAVNLTAIRDPVEAVTLHVLDSLSAVPLLRRWQIRRLLDIGSGGGYPGLPLAVVLPAQALLVESIAKKARFLETVVEAVGVAAEGGADAAMTARSRRGPSVAVAAVRAEALARDPAHRETWPLVTARAVGGLAELVELAFPLLEPGGRLVAWKRLPLDDDLPAARRAAAALGAGRVSVEPVSLAALPGHVLAVVEKRAPTADGYPREPAARRRRPW